MSEKQSNSPETSKAVNIDEAEDLEDDIDIKELVQLDEILGNSASGKVEMLDFERQMFLDCVYNDGLVICGK